MPDRSPSSLSDSLRIELDNAIRGGLVEAGVRGQFPPIVGAILRRIEAVLTTETPDAEVVAAWIEDHHGFVRIGSDKALIGDKVVGGAVLVDALLRLQRKDDDA